MEEGEEVAVVVEEGAVVEEGEDVVGVVEEVQLLHGGHWTLWRGPRCWATWLHLVLLLGARHLLATVLATLLAARRHLVRLLDARLYLLLYLVLSDLLLLLPLCLVLYGLQLFMGRHLPGQTLALLPPPLPPTLLQPPTWSRLLRCRRGERRWWWVCRSWHPRGGG